METLVTPSFWKGKKVFLTGHTGFKGAWMTQALLGFGAQITGYSLQPPTSPSLFEILNLVPQINSIIGDIRDYDSLKNAFNASAPEIVIHMAAQPIVRDSYKDPRYTYETNVMGTVNILECARQYNSVKSILNVTTDKVYKNNEWCWGYRENDPLDGYDPYSNSKSCSDIVTHSYKSSFFNEKGIAVSTARAGNVIGGGDFANDRIIPDCVRAVLKNDKIIVRNPNSSRPYQHVLEPIMAYLMIAEKQYKNNTYSDWYNVGPNEESCVTTGTLVDLFCKSWGPDVDWITENKGGPHEANFLKLDCSKIKQRFGWQPRWTICTAILKTCEWTKAWQQKEALSIIMNSQIKDYLGE